jgi:hypothetical protein
MMGTVLYQVAERFGTIFLKEIAIWATRPQHLTFCFSSEIEEVHLRNVNISATNATDSLTPHQTEIRGGP